jgi:hypothetical protein
MTPNSGMVETGGPGQGRRPGISRRAVLRLDAWFYPDYVPGFDNDLCRQKILAAIDKGSSVLDLGAGVGVRAYAVSTPLLASWITRSSTRPK